MAINGKALAAGLVVLAAVVAVGFYYKGGGKGAAKPKAAPLVSVTRAQALDLPVRIDSQGHLVPLKQVDVRAQISARLRAIHFREGDDVRAGQLLFTLDDAELEAQLERTRAQATQVKAQLEDAQRALSRGRELVGTGYISSSALDTLAANVKTLEAQRRGAQAEIDAARVQLAHTRIVAPMDGKTGALAAYEGSLVQAGDSAPLVSLLQFDPIAAEFALPERHLDALLAARARGQVQVRVQAPGGKMLDGELFFIDNRVNPATGTLQLKARFPNPGHALWPGAYARVELLAGSDPGVIVLPPQAVLEGPDGHFVYRLGDDRKVRAQAVTLLRIQEQNAVVTGVGDGDQVVVEGNQNLRDGSEVQVADAPAAGGTP